MSELRVGTYRMPGAELGPENPLPLLDPINPVGGPVEADPDIPEEDRRYIGWGVEVSILPHRLQDGYTRRREPMDFPALVLENETLRATFLPTIGGRLWSLYHKPAGRELLYVNPVFQPANLAVRNAWFSGGVEWNAGIRGHTPYTCSPLFAARVRGPGGTPVLRMYEWDRIRRVFFQIDAFLPDGSPVLFVRPRLVNPLADEIPMYWWSNIAVPETPETRVVAPADSAYKMAYGGRLSHIPVPEWEGLEVTRPTRIPNSNDFFFRVVEGRRPWITALDRGGRGLIQASTPRLRGRKLFVWGMGPGGRRWQEFLAEPGEAYIEIQAGLARTQYECLPMPGRADWSWLEAYGLMEADPAVVHGEWRAAREHVSQRLDGLVTPAMLEERHARFAETADAPPEELLRLGSGWAALEQRREPGYVPPGLVFPDASLTADQEPWLRLLEDGELPHRPPTETPGQFLVQPEWRALLEAAVAAGRGDHWLSWLHLGLMRRHAGDHAGAREAWTASLERERSPWVLRNLAWLARKEGRPDEAADLMEEACRMRPHELRIAVEFCEAALAAGRPAEMLRLASSLPNAVRDYGRIRMQEARAALDIGDLDGAERVLTGRFELGDIREGDAILTDLWFELQERKLARSLGREVDDDIRAQARRDFPPPAEIDFRMRT